MLYVGLTVCDSLLEQFAVYSSFLLDRFCITRMTLSLRGNQNGLRASVNYPVLPDLALASPGGSLRCPSRRRQSHHGENKQQQCYAWCSLHVRRRVPRSRAYGPMSFYLLQMRWQVR